MGQSFLKGATFPEIEVGQSFGASITVTEAHIMQACGMFGDFNPVHSNESFARKTLFGRRVLHGPFTSALLSAPVGMHFEGSAIGYLEHNCRFLKPVYAGDTLSTTWTVTAVEAKPKHDGGVVHMKAECLNQDALLVASATGVILISNSIPDI